MNLEKFKDHFNELCTTLIIYLGIQLSLMNILKIPGDIWWTTLVGCIVLLLFQYLPISGKYKGIFTGVLVILFILLIRIEEPHLLNGMLLTVNQMTEQLGRFLGIMIEGYTIQVNEELFTQCYFVFWGYISIFIALITCVFRHKKYLFFVLFVLPFSILQLAIGMGESKLPSIMLLIGYGLLAWYTYIHGSAKNKVIGNGKRKIGFQIIGYVVGIGIFAVLILQVFVPYKGYTESKFAEKIRYTISKTVNNLRYEKEKTNSYTQGDFRSIRNLEEKDTTALEVVMDQPVSLYLKGYVGGTYTATGWKEAKKDVLYEKKDLFYWLDKNTFSPFTQLADIYALEEGKNNEISVTVQNVNANSKYIYMPYEMTTNPKKLENTRSAIDGSVQTTGFFGNRLYKYKTNTNLVKSYPQIASAFYKNCEEKNYQKYTQSESYYNAFVYDTYTQIPEDVRVLLTGKLDEEAASLEKHISYETANTIVMGYLQKNIEYSEKVETFLGDRDFVHWILQNNPKGYAVHYATLATVMYRYLGIPARYVEGYLITPEMVKDVRAYQTIQVTGQEAHAWVEIYQDGIGWIPMEVTPPYLDKMERPDFTLAEGVEEAEGNTGGLETGASEQIKDKVQKEERAKSKKEVNIPAGILIIIGISILVIMMILLICYILHRRKNLRKKKAYFFSEDNRIAICHMYDYILDMLEYEEISMRTGAYEEQNTSLENAFSKAYVDEFKEVRLIAQESAFSRHAITEDKKRAVNQLMEKTIELILAKKNGIQKLRMRYWNFIY